MSEVDSTVIEKIKNIINLVKDGKNDEASTLWRKNFVTIQQNHSRS